MEYRPVRNVQAEHKKSNKLAIVIYLAANVALALVIYFGLKMRGMV
jgi:hypothetical protein